MCGRCSSSSPARCTPTRQCVCDGVECRCHRVFTRIWLGRCLCMRHVPAQGRRRGAQGATCLARFRRVHMCVCMRYRLQMLAFVAQHGFWHIFLSHTRHIARQESATFYESFIVAAPSLSPAPCIGLLYSTLQAEEQTRLGRLWLLQVSQVFFFLSVFYFIYGCDCFESYHTCSTCIQVWVCIGVYGC